MLSFLHFIVASLSKIRCGPQNRLNTHLGTVCICVPNGAGELAQQLRILESLTKDMGSVLSIHTHMVAHSHP